MNLFRYYGKLPKGFIGCIFPCGLLFIIVLYRGFKWQTLCESFNATTSTDINADAISNKNLHPASGNISRLDSIHEAPANAGRTSPYNRMDLHELDDGDYRVVDMKSNCTIKICIHKNESDDIHITRTIALGGVWERDILEKVKKALSKEPSMGLLDIGSNIGVFTLVSAKMNHSVVAVEALPLHAFMLRRSAQINSLEDKIILINNAVSNTRRTVQMQPIPGNMGGTYVTEIKTPPENKNTSKDAPRTSTQSVQTILLDDLVDIIPFKRAFMKLDIENHEPYAIAGAERLFKEIDIPVILCEFGLLRIQKDINDVNAIHNMFNFFKSRNYQSYFLNGTILPYEDWRSWPWEIFFKRTDYKL